MSRGTTLGPPYKAVGFTYKGSVTKGVEIVYNKCTVKVSAKYFALILAKFQGKNVAGGFSVTKPTKKGFGEWIRDNSGQNFQRLTPGHGSRIAAILVHENYATSVRIGNAVFLTFFTHPSSGANAGIVPRSRKSKSSVPVYDRAIASR